MRLDLVPIRSFPAGTCTGRPGRACATWVEDSAACGAVFHPMILSMTSETYPNGMTATFTRDQAGEAVGVEYVKMTHCTEKCVLFSEATVPAIGGETLSRSNTLTNDAYVYDAAGRLMQTTETPAGKGCTTRIYAYDEESNRTGLTTREPGLEGIVIARQTINF
jgi:hypothetical protein